jgi:hypothetical protein
MLENAGFHDVIAEDRTDQAIPLWRYTGCIPIFSSTEM